MEVKVQAIGEGIHEGAEPHRTRGVFGAELGGVDEELHAQVAVEFFLAFDFGEAAEGVNVVKLDAVEIVLGLRVEQAEDGVGVGFSEDVGNAPGVADDGDVAGVLLPAGEVGGWASVSKESMHAAGMLTHECLCGPVQTMLQHEVERVAGASRLPYHVSPPSPIKVSLRQLMDPSGPGPSSSRPHRSKDPAAQGPIGTKRHRPKASAAQGPISPRPRQLKALSA
jgi:hypothetical protein